MTNIQTILRYIDVATAAKPAASSVPVGSEFYAYDTHDKWVNTTASWERADPTSYPYFVEIAEGIRTNHTAFYKPAFQPAVVGSTDVIWGVANTTYAFPSVAMGMEIVSDNSGDSSAGAGARTVHVHYLNASFEEKLETITMNGTSVVPTASVDFFRINYFELETVGSTGTAIGNIDIRHLANTPVYGRIVAGQTFARDGVYTVPANKFLYISDAHFSAVHTAANKYTLMTVRSNYDRRDDVSSSVFFPEMTTMLESGADVIHPSIPIKFSETTDLKLVASSNGVAAVNVALRGWLENE